MASLPDLSGIRILRTDADIRCPEIDTALRDAGAELVLTPPDIESDELQRRIVDIDLLLMCYTPITRAIIDAGARLRGIVKYGVGIDAIDIHAAMARRIPVVNVPDYAEETVAEGAFALLLSLLRRSQPLSRAMRSDGWVSPEPHWLGRDLAGRTVALVGTGRIGRSLARMCGAGFRARVIGYDPHVSTAGMQAAGVEKFDDLHELLGQADIVSLHCVLNEQTHGLIGAGEFAAMHRRPLLINVSRGALVDEAALLEALRSGQISGAGLDVYVNEPLTLDTHPLRELFARDNVVLSPHLTFYTEEAMARLSASTLARCREILCGEPVQIHSSDPRLRAQREGVLLVST